MQFSAAVDMKKWYTKKIIKNLLYKSKYLTQKPVVMAILESPILLRDSDTKATLAVFTYILM